MHASYCNSIDHGSDLNGSYSHQLETTKWPNFIKKCKQSNIRHNSREVNVIQIFRRNLFVTQAPTGEEKLHARRTDY